MSSFRRAGKMSTTRVGNTLAEGNFFAGVPRQRRSNSTRARGSAPGNHYRTEKAPALKARFTSGPFRSIVGVMPQSLSKVIIHIIFSTKDREPWLGLDVRPRMHAYLATICRDLGAEVVRVGGVADHVHIVTTLPRTVSQAQLIEADKEGIIEVDQNT